MELLRSPKLVPSMILVILFLAFCDVNIVMRASAEQKICNITEKELDECKPSVSGSDPPPPSTECCDALKDADLPCLCSYKNSGLLPALGIDPDLAMKLPEKCGMKAPDNC